MTARLTFSDDVPKRVRRYVRAGARLLGLSHWEIRCVMTDSPHGHNGRRGSCLALPRSLNAQIELARDIETDSQTRATVLHELLHIATAPIDQAVEDRIIELVPEEHRDHARELYLDGLEVAVQRTARALADHLPTRPKEDTTCAAS